MIKLVKLSEEDRILKEKLLKVAPSTLRIPKLTRYTKPVYLPNIDEILAVDEFVNGYNVLADSYLLNSDDYIPQEIVNSVAENHINGCEFCEIGEPCPILPSILAAWDSIK